MTLPPSRRTLPLKGGGLILLLLALFLLFTPPALAQSFQSRDGGPVSVADFAGRVLLLDVWATWCAPCVTELPHLRDLQRDLGPQGLAVAALSIDRGGWPKVDWFLKRHDLSGLPVYLDDDRLAAQALGVTTLPAAFLFDRAGRLVARIDGPHDWAAERARLESLLAGQAP